MTDSDEFNTTNIDNMLDDNLNDSNVIKRNYTNNNNNNSRKHKRSSLYINSTGALSTSPSFIESSPIFSNDKTKQFTNTKNDSFYESSRFDDIRIKKEQQHQQQQELFDSLKLNNLLMQHQQQQQDASILCNNIINSTAAIYPLIVMNLLQNPIALQTALANQLMNTNLNAALGSSPQAPSPNESSTEYKAYNKRKTHLSNRFYRETNETSMISPELSMTSNIDSNKCSSSSSSSADPEEYNTTPTSSSSCSSYSSPLTMFESYKDFNQMQSQQQQQLLQQHQQSQLQQQQQQKPTRKINFGDISDLIN